MDILALTSFDDGDDDDDADDDLVSSRCKLFRRGSRMASRAVSNCISSNYSRSFSVPRDFPGSVASCSIQFVAILPIPMFSLQSHRGRTKGGRMICLFLADRASCHNSNPSSPESYWLTALNHDLGYPMRKLDHPFWLFFVVVGTAMKIIF